MTRKLKMMQDYPNFVIKKVYAKATYSRNGQCF